MWANNFIRICLVSTCSFKRADAADTPCLCLPDLTAHGSNGLMTKNFRAAVALHGIHLTRSMDYCPQIIVPSLFLYLLFLLCPSTASLLMNHILRWSPKTVIEISGLCLAGWLVGVQTKFDTFRQHSSLTHKKSTSYAGTKSSHLEYH